jgi:1,4-dihydroxy-2-naphthoate octaprenyltransferase
LFGKHTDKLAEDRKKRVFTLPVILGEKAARYTNIANWIVQYLLVGFIVIKGMASPVLLIVVFALPGLIKAIRIYSKPRPTEAPSDLPPGVWPLYLSARAFQYNKLFGSLFLLGIILDVVLTKGGVF